MSNLREDIGLLLALLGGAVAAFGALVRAVWNVAGRVSRVENLMDRVERLPCENHINRLMTIEAEDRRRADALIHMADSVNEFKTVIQQIEHRRENQERVLFATMDEVKAAVSSVREHLAKISGTIEVRKHD